MLVNLNSLLLPSLKLPLCSIVAASLAAARPQTGNPGHISLNISQFHNATPISNISEFRTVSIPLPYSFYDPSTQTYLRLGFGLFPHRLDPMSLAGLITTMQFEINTGIDRFGEDAYPGLNIVHEEQRFGWTLGDGFHFEMRSVQYSGRFFTWLQLSHVVEGLWQFLVVGERPFATVFDFRDGPGRWRKVLGKGGFVVDRGRLGKITAL